MNNPNSSRKTSSPQVRLITSEDALLSSCEVAQIIGKSEAWLARKRWEGGGIPYRKIGRHVRYQRSVVYSWLNQQPQMQSTSE
jgi:predicted DNA-binding transcriptional regulator AlpA